LKIKKILESGGLERGSFPSVFDAWARPGEKRTFTPPVKGMICDAFAFHNAGTDTTAHTLTIGIWHLFKDKERLKRLRDEVTLLIPITKMDERLTSLSALEQLPYLVSDLRPYRHHVCSD
jgi:hypothetical protein